MKRKMLALTVCVVFFIGVFFFPRPIVNDVATSVIHSIEFNPYFGQDEPELVFLTEYDEAEILKCLEKYSEYRTLTLDEGRRLGDMELYITITTGGELKAIVLGNVNYTTKSYGALKRGIYNADALREELLDVLGLPE